jgi:hypothetical protein
MIVRKYVTIEVNYRASREFVANIVRTHSNSDSMPLRVHTLWAYEISHQCVHVLIYTLFHPWLFA